MRVSQLHWSEPTGRVCKSANPQPADPRAKAHVDFFSYREISPHAASGCCGLHHQTMTVTRLSEAA